MIGYLHNEIVDGKALGLRKADAGPRRRCLGMHRQIPFQDGLSLDRAESIVQHGGIKFFSCMAVSGLLPKQPAPELADHFSRMPKLPRRLAIAVFGFSISYRASMK